MCYTATCHSWQSHFLLTFDAWILLFHLAGCSVSTLGETGGDWWFATYQWPFFCSKMVNVRMIYVILSIMAAWPQFQRNVQPCLTGFLVFTSCQIVDYYFRIYCYFISYIKIKCTHLTSVELLVSCDSAISYLNHTQDWLLVIVIYWNMLLLMGPQACKKQQNVFVNLI